MKPVKPWDLLNKDNWTYEEVYDKRMEICRGCKHLNKIGQCEICHCFMLGKTRLKNAYCPVGNW